MYVNTQWRRCHVRVLQKYCVHLFFVVVQSCPWIYLTTNTVFQNSHVVLPLPCFHIHTHWHTFTLFCSRKTLVIVERYQLSFCIFMCAFHPEISIFFGKSFLFLFLFLWYVVTVNQFVFMNFISPYFLLFIIFLSLLFLLFICFVFIVIRVIKYCNIFIFVVHFLYSCTLSNNFIYSMSLHFIPFLHHDMVFPLYLVPLQIYPPNWFLFT